jgi:hypothetical protein
MVQPYLRWCTMNSLNVLKAAEETTRNFSLDSW